MSEKLKACWHCGGKNIADWQDPEDGLRNAICKDCGCGLPYDEWNTRPLEDVLEEQVAKWKASTFYEEGRVGELSAINNAMKSLLRECIEEIMADITANYNLKYITNPVYIADSFKRYFPEVLK